MSRNPLDAGTDDATPDYWDDEPPEPVPWSEQVRMARLKADEAAAADERGAHQAELERHEAET